MEREKWKACLWIITYAIGLVLVVIHIEDILRAAGFFFQLFRPLLYGIVIAFILNHPYETFRRLFRERARLRERPARICAILSVYVVFFGAIGVLTAIVIPEVVQNILLFAANADSYLAELQALLDQVTQLVGIRPIDLSELSALIDQYLGSLTQAINDLLPQILAVTSNVVSWIATAGLSLALSVYVMNGKERLLSQVRRCLRVYLPRRIRPGFATLVHTIYDVFDNYVAGQCKEAVILGTLCFLGMTVLGLDYAGMISVVVGVTALVPILGAYIGSAVGVLLLLFVSPGKALLFLIFLIILQQVEGNVIYPKVVGHKIGLPGMWVLLAINVGGGLGGIWGMLISVPVTTILFRLLRQDVRRREQALQGGPEDGPGTDAPAARPELQES